MSVDPVASASDDAVAAGDRLRKEGRREEAVEAYLAAASSLTDTCGRQSRAAPVSTRSASNASKERRPSSSSAAGRPSWAAASNSAIVTKSSGVKGSGWLGHHIELSFNDGIAYKKNFTWGGTPLRLKIWGPVIKGDAGLGVRLKGLDLRGHPVELRARATTDLQDLQLNIEW